MKKNNLLLVLLIMAFYSCDNNDDQQSDPQNPTDGFTHNGAFSPTENAYFEIDEDDDNPMDGFPDEYNFFFSNARMADGDVSTGAPIDAGEYIFTFNLSNFVLFNLNVESNPSLANSAPTAGNTYIGDAFDANFNTSPNTLIVKNYVGSVESLSTPYFINGVEYGNPTVDDEANVQGIGSPAPTITINAINIDTNNPSLSTMDVDYVYYNALGEMFTGHYEGTFGIILD